MNDRSDTPRPGAASDNPASRKGSVEAGVDRLAEVAVAVTPAIDALATAVRDLGGTMCVAVEVDGHLFTRRSLRSRFAVTLRDPGDGAAVEQELAPVGTLNALVGAFHALRGYQYGNAATALAMDMADRLKVLLDAAGEDVPDVEKRPTYPIRTVGDLIANLRELDADMKVHGADFVEIDGQRYAVVVWTALEPVLADSPRPDITAPPTQRPELDGDAS